MNDIMIYIYIYNGVSKPTYNRGASSCRIYDDSVDTW